MGWQEGKALTADSWQGMELAGGSIFTSGFHVLDQTLSTRVVPCNKARDISFEFAVAVQIQLFKYCQVFCLH